MFDFEANQWRLHLGGGVQVIYNRKKSYVLLVGVGTDAPGAGDHLRINVPPADADETFDLHPHVTERRKQGVTRRPFRARVPLKSFAAFAQKAAEAMHEAWGIATQRVDLEELTEQELWALDPTEEAKQELCRVLFQACRGELRLALSTAMIDYWFDFIKEHFVFPIELEPPEETTPGLYPVLRFTDDGIESVGHLNWFPHGCGADEMHRKPGWYLTDMALFQRESMRAFFEVVDDKLISAMRAIHVALGHGPELSDAAEALLRQREEERRKVVTSASAAKQFVGRADAQPADATSEAHDKLHDQQGDRLRVREKPLVPEVMIRKARRSRVGGREGSMSRTRRR